MDITDEQLADFINRKNEKELEFRRLRGNEILYKKRISDGTFQPVIKWELDINSIDLTKLKTRLISDIVDNVKTDYIIVTLDLDKVVSRLTLNGYKAFSKNDLWGLRHPYDITRLIEFIEDGHEIIPPIIQLVDKTSLTVIDGNHRMALCRYLRLEKIPFLIKKIHLHNAIGLE